MATLRLSLSSPAQIVTSQRFPWLLQVDPQAAGDEPADIAMFGVGPGVKMLVIAFH